MIVGPQGQNRRVARRQLIQAADNLINSGYVSTKAQVIKKSQPKKSKKKSSKKVSSGSKYGGRVGRRQTKSASYVPKAGKKNLKQRIDAIEKDLKQDLSYKFYKFIDARGLSCDLGRSRFDDLGAIVSQRIQNAIDDLAIGTGTDINLVTVAENTQIQIKDCWAECIATNVVDQPCTVDLYALTSKFNTSTAPDSFLRVSGTNYGYPAPDGTDTAQSSVVMYPTDIPDFNKSWHVIGHVKGIMEPGDNLRLTASIPDFVWSQDNYVQEGSPSYFKKKNIVFMMRVMGETCFDSASVGRTSTLPARIAARCKGYFTVEYAGNVASRECQVEDSYDTGTFAGVPTTIGAGVSAYTG